MDSGKKPRISAVESSEENFSDQKKSAASSLDQKSGAVIRLEDKRIERDSERLVDEMAELVQSMTTAFDESQGAREIRANHRSVTGWVAGQNVHNPIPFESTLERDFAYLALFEPTVSRLQAQPMTLTYRDGIGRIRRYTPDFLVEYAAPCIGTWPDPIRWSGFSLNA